MDDTGPIGIDFCVALSLGIRDGNVRGVVKLITDHNIFKPHSSFIANTNASKSAHLLHSPFQG